MISSEEKKDINIILKKHVNTIHCSNNLTLVQRKLFNALLFNAYHEMSDKSQYSISIKKLCRLIGYDSRDYKKLKKSIMDLITTAIEWNVIENNHGELNEKWRASAIVSAAKIENGVCSYEFSSVMRELLYRPEIYGKVDLNVMTAFNSSYGLALYENCIRFQSIATTPWLPINTFRKLMGITENRYQNFCDFKKRVLDVAVKEVNLYSPIKVVPEIQRINKKVISIKFKLSSSNQLNQLDDDGKNLDSELINILKMDFHLSDKALSNILSQYDEEYIKNKIKFIKSSENFKSGKIREIAGYLIDALKKDYKRSKSSKDMIKEEKIREDREISQTKAQEEAKQRKSSKQKKLIIETYLDSITTDQKEQLTLDFEKKLLSSKDAYAIKSYKRFGMRSKIVQALYNCYLTEIINKKQLNHDIPDVCVMD